MPFLKQSANANQRRGGREQDGQDKNFSGHKDFSVLFGLEKCGDLLLQLFIAFNVVQKPTKVRNVMTPDG